MLGSKSQILIHFHHDLRQLQPSNVKISKPVSAVLSIKPSWTRFAAQLPSVSGFTGTRTIGRVTLPVGALAVALTALTPESLPALTSARELLAGRVVAVALRSAVTAKPARIADASSRGLLAHRVDAAVTVVVALCSPVTRMAGAFPSFLVTLPFLTMAGFFTVFPPAVGVTAAFPGHVVAFTIGVTCAQALAVGTPELSRALWRRIKSIKRVIKQ